MVSIVDAQVYCKHAVQARDKCPIANQRFMVVCAPYNSPMTTTRRRKPLQALDNPLLAIKPRKGVPHEFVLDALGSLSPWTRPMFGCLAVYVKEKIVLVLRDKPGQSPDNGVWLATTSEHHESLRREFPHMRSIRVLGKEVTGWQVLPADASDFEEAALRACEMVIAGDPRIGKVPKSRRAPKPSAGGNAKSAKRR